MARKRREKEETAEHRGHTIELITDELGKRVLRIDGQSLRYGQFEDGLYFLRPYAYDADESLIEVARRYIDHQDRAARVRAEQED
jgi:hypothetical protein